MQVTITLNDELYRELQSASQAMLEMGYTPARFATEIVESDLASRRLPKVMRLSDAEVYARRSSSVFDVAQSRSESEDE